MTHLKTWWKVYGHTLAAAAIMFLDPSVKVWEHSHPAQAVIGLVWSYFLLYAKGAKS